MGWMELKDPWRARDLLERCFAHIAEPFKVVGLHVSSRACVPGAGATHPPPAGALGGGVGAQQGQVPGDTCLILGSRGGSSRGPISRESGH